MWRRLIATSPTWITVPLRLALGIIFIAHGSQKVFGAFGGKGLAAFMSGPTPFGFMQPSSFWLGAAAFSELIGGVLVLLGLCTRLGALFISFVMLTAIFGFHLKNGFFAPQGYEYPYALLGICLALLIAGGGHASLDGQLATSGRGGRRR
ncbi:MAG: DoxX family protein [Pyrinomonadaceae bacterium]